MTEEEVIELSIELRIKLFNALHEFWLNKENLSKKDVFYINSIMISSLISQTAYSMFKKDNIIHVSDYIKDICSWSIKQSEDFFNESNNE